MSYREVTHHHIEGRNENLIIHVDDGPDKSGACHQYSVTDPEGTMLAQIFFQDATIQEHSINGIQNEVLLAIVIDRLEGFQKGNFPCDQNENALIKCRESLEYLKDRTRDRIKRGVEGYSKA